MKTSVKMILDDLIIRYPELQGCRADILSAFDIIVQAYKNGCKVLICGNGGSAADAEHIAGELMKGFLLKRTLDGPDHEKLVALHGPDGEYLADHLQGALPAVSLAGHPALSSAFMNDVAPDMVFAQQVFGFGRRGDILLALSTSGRSQNIVQAVKTAKAFGIRSVGLTGSDGGTLSIHCDVTIRVPASETYRIQEYHLPIYHALCAMLEYEFFDR